MNKIPVKVTVSTEETVTITLSEYNDLIAARVQRDMILATADASGYGCAEIVKGARSLDAYSKALANAEERYCELTRKHDEAVDDLVKEIADLKTKLKEALGVETGEIEPEGKTDA